jgi:[ribosomal protein S18]-alanine N-acetyltransferase
MNRRPCMELTLRDYSAGDFDTLHAIDCACYPPGIAYSRRTLRWFLNLADAQCLVAQSGAAADAPIIGFIVGQAAGTRGHIITLDVSEAHRREGVGSALLAEIERRFAERGVREIELETATSNEAGVAFWQGHGYRGVGVLRRYYLGRLDAYHMRKSLDPSQEDLTRA